MQGATFLQNAENVPYEFLSELYGNKNGFYHDAPLPPVVNGIRSTEESVLPKASPGEEIE